jgi:hypothetical protein
MSSKNNTGNAIIQKENGKEKEKENGKTDPPINFQEFLKEIPKYLGPGIKYCIMLLFCIFIGILFSTTINVKPDVVYLKKYVYIMTIVIPLLLLIYLFLRKGHSDLDPKLVMLLGGSIVFITIVIMVSYYKDPSTSSASSIMMQSYIINLILLAIVIVGLAIGYKVLENSAKKMRGWPGFIINFLFFIPCLLTDLIEYMLSEFKNAPNSVFILYIIEISLILAYIYVPKLMKYLIIKNGITLQHKPVYLNKNKILSNSDIFLLPNTTTSTLTSDISSNSYNSNFGLSMWIYVNNMGINTLSTKGSALFQISSPNNKYGKPSINFIGNDQWKYTFTDQLIKYNIVSSSETKQFLIDANANNTSVDTLYNKFLQIENNSTNYLVTYTFSYGINDFQGSVNHKKTDTYNHIYEVKDKIKNDYENYKLISERNINEQINAKLLNPRDAEYLTLEDMFGFVTKITQTVKYKGETNFIFTTPSQKWNHIVFNYYENNVDLFINGNLEKSMDLKNSPIHILPTDVISVGTANGINGSICNIVYYDVPLTKTKISHIYNMNFMKNPPI